MHHFCDTDAVGALVESTQPNSIIGFEVDADAVGQATVKELKIECIPSVLLFANSKEVARVTGTDVSELIMKIKEAIIKCKTQFFSVFFILKWQLSNDQISVYPLAANLDQTPGNLEARLKQLINSSPLFIFMKGTPSAPRFVCKQWHGNRHAYFERLLGVQTNIFVPSSGVNLANNLFRCWKACQVGFG